MRTFTFSMLVQCTRSKATFKLIKMNTLLEMVRFSQLGSLQNWKSPILLFLLSPFRRQQTPIRDKEDEKSLQHTLSQIRENEGRRRELGKKFLGER